MVKKEGSGKGRSKDTTALLIENFAGLQQALTNLSAKFSELSDNFSKILKVFEDAAKNMAKEKYPSDEELHKKLDELFEQNKTIAKSLILIQEKMDKQEEKIKTPPQPNISPPPYRQPSMFPPTKQPPRPLPGL